MRIRRKVCSAFATVAERILEVHKARLSTVVHDQSPAEAAFQKPIGLEQISKIIIVGLTSKGCVRVGCRCSNKVAATTVL